MATPFPASQTAAPRKATTASGGSAARVGPPPALVWLSALLCVLFVACAPFMYYDWDVSHFGYWALATRGTTPWLAYSLPDCNYPAIPLEILTLVEKIRLGVHAPFLGSLELILIKLPNGIAILGGAAVCYYGLRARLGDAYARYAAGTYGLCAALWFNGAVWGQYDSILCLGMVAAVVALVNDRPGWCGIALGLALEVKPQPIIIFPVIGFYWLARRDWRAIGLGIAGAVGAWGALAIPFFLAHAGKPFIGGYIGSYNLFQEVTVYAWNGWWLVQHIGGHLLHLKNANSDRNTLFHLVTFKQIGELLYLAYLAFLFVGLWRRPTRYNGALACAVSAFAFFMLPCDIHERYIIMAVALMPVIVPATGLTRTKSAYTLYLSLSVVALLEHLVFCEFRPLSIAGKTAPLQHILMTKVPIGVPISLFDLALLAWAGVMYWREVYKAPADAPDVFAPNLAQPV